MKDRWAARTSGQSSSRFLPAADVLTLTRSFKNVFGEILPLRQPTKAPTHPFLQTCILAYLALLPRTTNPLTAPQSREILARVHDDLSHAISSPASVPIISGLLILSHLPGFPMVPPRPLDADDGGRALPSLLVLVQMAKSMAVGLGMDRAVPSLVGIEDDGVRGLDGYMLVRFVHEYELCFSVLICGLLVAMYTTTGILVRLSPGLSILASANP